MPLRDDKHAISVMVGRLVPKGPGSQGEEPGDGNSQGIEAAAEDLIRAVEMKDARGVAEALGNAFAILESEPRSEAMGESEEDEDEYQ